MNALLGRVLLVATAMVAVGLARQQETSPELPRVIPIVIVQSSPSKTPGGSTPAGSVDAITDTAAGLLIEGWVGSGVDRIFVVVVGSDDASPDQRVVLFARPDVAAAGYGALTGFSAVLSTLEKISVRCVILSGPLGSAEVWTGSRACD